MGSAISRTLKDGDGKICHRSLNCRVPTVVRFVNASDVEVAVTWLDYTGARLEYKRLKPGEAYRQPTYTTHPWVFRAVDPRSPTRALTACGPTGRHQQVFYPPPLAPGTARTRVAIHAAPALPWSPETHAHFPASFRRTARAVLLAHHRQPPGSPTAVRRSQRVAEHGRQRSGPDSSCTIANLPKDLVLTVLGKAAPCTLNIVYPPLPEAVQPGELAPHHRAVLFA